MTSMLTNTTDALLMSLIVSAATTGHTDRHGGAGNEFDRSLDASSLRMNNASLSAGSSLQCNVSRCEHVHHPDGSSEPPSSLAFVVGVSVLAGLICCLTIAGNVALIAAIVIEPTLRHSTNYFLVSLAVSDLWIGLISIPLYTKYLIEGHWEMGRVLCNIWLCLDWVICAAAQYTVFLITLDLYLSMTTPVWYSHWRTDNKVIGMIAIVWIVPGFVYPPLVLAYQPEGYVKTPKECEIAFLSDPWLAFGAIITDFWVVVIIMFYFYCRIYRISRKIQEHWGAMLNIVRRNNTSVTRNDSWHFASGSHFRFQQSQADLTNGDTGFTRPSSAAIDHTWMTQSCGDTTETRKVMFDTPSIHTQESDDVLDTHIEQTRNTTMNGLGRVPPSKNLVTSDVASDTLDNNASAISSIPSHSQMYAHSTVSWHRWFSSGLFRSPKNAVEDHSHECSSKISPNTICSDNSTDFHAGTGDKNIKTTLKHKNIDFTVTKDTQTTKTNNQYNKGNIKRNTTKTNSNDINKNNGYKNTNNSNEHSSNNSLRPLQPRQQFGIGRPSTMVYGSHSNLRPAQSIHFGIGRPSTLDTRDPETLGTINMILGAFLICWTPFHIVSMAPVICGQDCVHTYIFHLAYWLCYLNSALNPFLNTYGNQILRLTMMRILKCQVPLPS